MKRRHTWTDDQCAQLRAHYPDSMPAQLESLFGLKIGQIYHKANKLGLRKSEAYKAAEQQRQSERLLVVGIPHRLQAGHATWNKGMKGLDLEGKATQFKPGNRPHNWRPLGYERISEDGYLERKITDDGPPKAHFKGVHVLVWEAEYGPVPQGSAIVFKNGNKRDIRLDNLECITRQELMQRNTRHNYPELKEVYAVKARITRTINQLEQTA